MSNGNVFWFDRERTHRSRVRYIILTEEVFLQAANGSAALNGRREVGCDVDLGTGTASHSTPRKWQRARSRVLVLITMPLFLTMPRFVLPNVYWNGWSDKIDKSHGGSTIVA